MRRVGAEQGRRAYKYFDFIMAAFVAVLLISNVVVVKVMRLGPFQLGPVTLGPWITDGATFLFPVTYIFGDILTEVYGYARARRVIWCGFGALAFASVMAVIVVALPPAPFWQHQAAYEVAFGSTWRIVGASMIAYFCGEFVNSFVLAKMKLKTEGRFLWLRTIGSTVVGQGVDSLIFYPLAFLGEWPAPLVVAVMTSNFLLKVGVEAAMTPATYWVVGFLKRAEGEDYYDRGTDFNPFKLEA